MLNPTKPTNWQSYLWITTLWRKFLDLASDCSKLPVIGEFFSPWWWREKNFDVQWIPINKQLENSGSSIIPLTILKKLIQKSAHRVILRQCACRQGYGCQNYPHDIGCLALGDATKNFDPSLGIHASVEEALEHVDKAVKAGLVPQVGQINWDAFLFGVTPASHYAIICFCCDCCCIVRRFGRMWEPIKNGERFYKSLEGVSVNISDTCIGCGECVDKCFMDAISIQEDQARINEKLCKICGVCVEQCPQGAISIEVTDAEKMEKAFFERIESKTDIYSSIPGREVNTKERDQAPHPRHGFAKVKYKHSRE